MSPRQNKHRPERVVEPSVEERVVAVGGHGDDVAGEEGCVVVAPAEEGVGAHVNQDVDDVEREPARAEDDDHRRAEAVVLAEALALRLLERYSHFFQFMFKKNV